MVLCDASDFANAAAEAAAKKSAQRHALGIADGRGDFIDGGAARLEHMHGLLDAEILEIGQRSLAERIADMPRQGALARGERARRLVEGEAVAHARAGPAFELGHQRVIMGEMVLKKRRHILHHMTGRERYGPVVHTEHGAKGHDPKVASQSTSLLDG